MDVSAWLRGLGLEHYTPAFRDNDIDAEILPELTADDLIGLGVTSIGHRRKLLAAIAALREAAPAPAAAPLPTEAAGIPAAERRQLSSRRPPHWRPHDPDRPSNAVVDQLSRTPRGTFPSFSFSDLLAGRVSADKLAGRIVLIGASFAGSTDSFAQPFGSTPMSGVERMANIIDTVTDRVAPRPQSSISKPLCASIRAATVETRWLVSASPISSADASTRLSKISS